MATDCEVSPLTVGQRLDGWEVSETGEGLLIIRYRGGRQFILSRRDTAGQTYAAVQSVVRAKERGWRREVWQLWGLAALVVITLCMAPWIADRIGDVLRLLAGP